MSIYLPFYVYTLLFWKLSRALFRRDLNKKILTPIFSTLVLPCLILIDVNLASGQQTPSNAPVLATLSPRLNNRAEPISKFFTHEQFVELANKLAPKVNLFGEVWALSPDAEFYGGTTRDFLYWIIGKFRDVKSKEEANQVRQSLQDLEIIDVREFIIGDSDIDILGSGGKNIEASKYGVRKIDWASASRFDPETEKGLSEIQQGFIPAEKIRLGKKGFVRWPSMGDGLLEIYQGRLSVHFSSPEVFKKTYYASRDLNHPILLALRYLRLQAMDYYQRFGSGYPTQELMTHIPTESREAIKKVFDGALVPGELSRFLEHESSQKWINGIIARSFKSYTNPTAAKALLDHYGVYNLPGLYPQIKSYQQYMFAPYRDQAKIDNNYKDFGVRIEDIVLPLKSEFGNDLTLYHGTNNMESFRSILFQGVRESSNGAMGKGLYGVKKSNIEAAISRAGNENLVVTFSLSPKSKIIDVEQGPGKKLLTQYLEKNPQSDLEGFCEAFGVDAIRYKYEKEYAYAVKNSAILSQAQGYKIKLMPLSKLIEESKKCKNTDDLIEFLRVLKINSVNQRELEVIWKSFENSEAIKKDLGVVQLIGAWVLEGRMPESGATNGVFEWGPKLYEMDFKPSKNFLKYWVPTLTNLNHVQFGQMLVDMSKINFHQVVQEYLPYLAKVDDTLATDALLMILNKRPKEGQEIVSILEKMPGVFGRANTDQGQVQLVEEYLNLARHKELPEPPGYGVGWQRGQPPSSWREYENDRNWSKRIRQCRVRLSKIIENSLPLSSSAVQRLHEAIASGKSIERARAYVLINQVGLAEPSDELNLISALKEGILKEDRVISSAVYDAIQGYGGFPFRSFEAQNQLIELSKHHNNELYSPEGKLAEKCFSILDDYKLKFHPELVDHLYRAIDEVPTEYGKVKLAVIALKNRMARDSDELIILKKATWDLSTLMDLRHFPPRTEKAQQVLIKWLAGAPDPLTDRILPAHEVLSILGRISEPDPKFLKKLTRTISSKPVLQKVLEAELRNGIGRRGVIQVNTYTESMQKYFKQFLLEMNIKRGFSSESDAVFFKSNTEKSIFGLDEQLIDSVVNRFCNSTQYASGQRN